MKSANSLVLVYVTDASPGITRQRRGKAFSYRDASGNVVGDEATLERIRRLAIPPAYESVWICTLANCRPQGATLAAASNIDITLPGDADATSGNTNGSPPSVARCRAYAHG